MAATAQEVSALLDAGRLIPRLDSLVNAAPVPSALLEGTAHFGAALHSAHWGQSSPLVSSLCEEAARTSAEVAQAMQTYLELQVRRAPIWACAAFERLSAVATPFLRNYILLDQYQPRIFDPVLLPAIANSLEKIGLPSLAFLDGLRKEERSLSGRPRDLLDPYHRESWADLDWLEWPSHFRRAYSPKSRYPWVSRTAGEVAFTLTCRRAGSADSGESQVWINGIHVTDFPLTPEWSTLRFTASADLVESGVNWLEIYWPLDLPDSQEQLESIAPEHEQDRWIPLLPVFAEISSLSAVQH
jgi:hypothetical protein